MHYDLMIVGESPSHTRPKGMENVHFSGRTSHILWDELRKYSITRDDCFVTNVVTKTLPRGTKPSDQDIKEGLVQLDEDINKAEPLLIVTVGRIASTAVIGKNINMLEESGQMFFPGELGVWVSPIIHPGAVARNSNLKKQFQDNIWAVTQALQEIRKTVQVKQR